jgi:hypothetical protein
MSKYRNTIIKILAQELLQKYESVDVTDKIQFNVAVNNYLYDLQYTMETHGLQTAVDVHKQIIFDSSFPNLGMRMLLLIIAVVCYALQQMIFVLIGFAAFLAAVLNPLASPGLNNLYEITNELHQAEGLPEKIILQPYIRELISQVVALSRAEHVANTLAIYTLGVLYHQLAILHESLAGVELHAKAVNHNKLAKEATQRAEQYFSDLARKDLSLGEICTFDLQVLEKYLTKFNPRTMKILKQRFIFRDCRLGVENAKHQTLAIMHSTLRQFTQAVTAEQLETMSPEELLNKIMFASNGAEIAQRFEDIAHDPIDTADLMFNPVTTMKGNTFKRESLFKWIEKGGNTDPVTNEKIAAKFIANKELMNLIDFLSLGGKVTEFPGYINPVTNKAYVRPILMFSGLNMESPAEHKPPIPENIIFRQVIENFTPKHKPI